jgi:hypothetical protein
MNDNEREKAIIAFVNAGKNAAAAMRLFGEHLIVIEETPGSLNNWGAFDAYIDAQALAEHKEELCRVLEQPLEQDFKAEANAEDLRKGYHVKPFYHKGRW